MYTYKSKIKGKKEEIDEIELNAKEKEMEANKKLDAEIETKLEKHLSKLILLKNNYESALNSFEEWQEKVADAKYKYKETGSGKESLKEAQKKLKDLKERKLGLELEIKVQEEVIQKIQVKFNDQKDKKLIGIMKKISAEKDKAIGKVNKEIKALKKKLASVKKEFNYIK